MLLPGYLSPSRLRYSSLISFFSRTPSPFLYHTHAFSSSFPSLLSLNTISMNKTTKLHLSSLSLSAAKTTAAAAEKSHLSRSQKKARRECPERLLRCKLEMCSKHGDLTEALRLYDDARSRGIPLSQHHYNILLYLCSSSWLSSGESNACKKGEFGTDLGLKRGFEIFRQMGTDEIPPNEATFTSVARLAAAVEDPEMAFDLVKKMPSFDIPPRLRSYGPALFGFCKKGEAKKAYEVDAHMVASGVSAEEPELAALLRVSADAARGDMVYQLLHRMRATVRRVSESTAEIVEGWFGSNAAVEGGEGRVGHYVTVLVQGIRKD